MPIARFVCMKNQRALNPIRGVSVMIHLNAGPMRTRFPSNNEKQRQIEGFHPMATFRVDFLDHGNRIYDTLALEHDTDEAAVEEARRRNVPSIGAGFDVWEGKRLVHRHRNG